MKTHFKSFALLLATGLFALACNAQPNVTLTQVASGFDRPIGIENCGDNRLFVVEQDGVIKLMDLDGNVEATPFLDITSEVNSQFNNFSFN